MKELWVEKYRPKTVNGYVFRDAEQRAQIMEWVNTKSIPHIILSGGPGVGKTTLAKLLINELGVLGHDVMELNASRQRGIDIIRDSGWDRCRQLSCHGPGFFQTCYGFQFRKEAREQEKSVEEYVDHSSVHSHHRDSGRHFCSKPATAPRGAARSR